jgi:hypothetical protein
MKNSKLDLAFNMNCMYNAMHGILCTWHQKEKKKKQGTHHFQYDKKKKKKISRVLIMIEPYLPELE